MKTWSKWMLALMALCLSVGASAQTDPTVMTINGKAVPLSEFMYSYKKNNTEGVIDKKDLMGYLDLFINYKLKVCAALDAKLDTLASFQQEYASYRDPQVVPAVVTDADLEAEAKRLYTEAHDRVAAKGGMVKLANISIFVPQKASGDEVAQAKNRMDSIYQALKQGTSFEELAEKFSADKATAKNGGEMPWVEKGQLFKEIEDKVFDLPIGVATEPFQSTVGWHIFRVNDRCDFLPYDTLRTNILTYIERSGVKEQLFNQKIDQMAAEATPALTHDQVLQQVIDEQTANDSELKYLLQEYHDGLLLYEISDREVWKKVSQDEAALNQYFKKNKKKYAWPEPRYKGMAYHVKTQADVAAVKKSVKGLAFDQWNERLRTTFNNDSTLRIRVEKGLFKKGDSPLIDREVFHQQVEVKQNPEFPIDAVYGKLLKGPEELNDVRSLVVSDMQEEREKQWVDQLRKRYSVVVNQEVLNAINE